MSYVSPFNCDNAWLSFEDILRKVYTPDGYIRTYGNLGAGYCPAFQDILDYWESVGATAPSDAEALAYNTWLCGMVDLGVYDKAEFLDLLSTHSQNTALTNWRNPGTFNPSEVNAPSWGQYLGYTGNTAASRHLRSNFTPSVNGTLIGEDNICVIIGVGNDINETQNCFGGSGTAIDLPNTSIQFSPRNGGVFYCACNTTWTSTANANSKKHFALSKNNGANFDSYQNLVKTNIIKASAGFCHKELLICGLTLGAGIQVSNNQLRYAFLFSYLTETEVQGIINLTEALLDTLGTGLI